MQQTKKALAPAAQKGQGQQARRGLLQFFQTRALQQRRQGIATTAKKVGIHNASRKKAAAVLLKSSDGGLRLVLATKVGAGMRWSQNAAGTTAPTGRPG